MKTYEERTQSVQKKLHRRQIQLRWTAATAGVLCLCILAGIVLPHFVNEPDKGKQNTLMNNKVEENVGENDRENEGEYAEVIRAIRDYHDYEEKHPNIDYGYVPEGWIGSTMTGPSAPGSAPVGSGNFSVEVTDHQVAGVLEGDLIKRSQTHIFYLRNSPHSKQLEVYPIAGAETELLSFWQLDADAWADYYDMEMYLSEDATRLSLILAGYGEIFAPNKYNAYVQVISLDVTDPANIRKLECITIAGSLISSRMVGDNILLMANYYMDAEVDFEDESTFLPQYGTPGNMESIPANCIVVPEQLTGKDYTVVTLLDGKNMTMLDCGAFMSYSTELYVSQANIYATRTYTETVDLSETAAKTVSMTEISCMAYSEESLTLNGTFSVEGRVKDQYSMDEHNGIFRVVTTTQSNDIEKIYGGYQAVTVKPTNANLTCFKVGTWEQVAQVAQFAPDGETVESVRFDGDYAYVCTAKVVTLTDPVFFFDLSDLNNITYKDTGVIEGYSSSLIQLKDGFLMGIGFDEDRNLKVEIYEETEEGVQSVCTFTNRGEPPTDYKAYYIDRENNIFGIPNEDGYFLLHFDGSQLVKLAKTDPIHNLDSTRGLVIDNYLYVFNAFKYRVKEIVPM